MEQFQLYRQHGVVGKLHNFVQAVCCSHKRCELFLSTFTDLAKEDPIWKFVNLQLLQDGGVRWHLVYVMLLRCQELREPIVAFQRKYKQQQRVDKEFSSGDDEGQHYSPVLDALSDDDWLEVDELINFLKVPYDLCKALEGNNSVSGFGSLWQTIVNLQALWQHYNYQSLAIDDDDDSYFATAVKFGLQKLNTYWEKLILDPKYSYYTVATALHPMLRLNWFKSTWRDFDDWHKKAEYSLNKMFDKYSAATSDSQEDEIEAKQQHQRRKLPASYANNPLAAVMQVDLAYFYGNHGSKRRKRENELANYIDDLNEDFNRDDDY
jgi:hypothetical protein